MQIRLRFSIRSQKAGCLAFLISAIAMLVTPLTAATLVNQGTSITVTEGAAIYVTGGGTVGNVDLRPDGLATAHILLNGEIFLDGDWSCQPGSGFDPASSGWVILNGASQRLFGTTVFPNLLKSVTVPATMTFPVGTIHETTITGQLVLAGAEGSMLALRSAVPGEPWYINPQGTRALAYLDVQDSFNSCPELIDVSASNCLDSGNNVGWIFGAGPHVITATAVGNGTIDPVGQVPVPAGTHQTFTMTPDAEHYLSELWIDGVPIEPTSTYTFMNVVSDHSIDAVFSAGKAYVITATVIGNGTVEPSGQVVVPEGASQTFTMTPDAGYRLTELWVDGASVEPTSIYTFTNVVSDHSIDAVFASEFQPTLDPIIDMTLSENASPLTINLTGITDGGHGSGEGLTVFAFSENPALIPDPLVNYTPPDTTGTLTLSPVAGKSGRALISVTVKDSAGEPGNDSITRTFTVYVLSNPSMLKDIRPGSSGSDLDFLTNVDGTAFFRANDGIYGAELWRSDGTVEGTRLVYDIRPGPESSFPTRLTTSGQTLYFVADDGKTGSELWASRTYDSDTRLVSDIRPGPDGSSPRDLTDVDGTLFFCANDGVWGAGLWRSLGSKETTELVKGFKGANPDGLYNRMLLPFQGSLFFCGDDGETGAELWRSSGTEEGTFLVRDIYPGPVGSFPYAMHSLGKSLFLSARDSSNGRQLWVSDGTSSGTSLFKKIAGRGDSYAQEFVRSGSFLYFVANNPATGYELWRTDGTSTGTVMVKDIRSGSASSNPHNLTDVAGTLYFAADDGVHGAELWKTDGTTSGTRMVLDIWPGSGGSFPGPFTGSGGILVFAADDGMHGTELWQSEGTETTTKMVKDIRPGPEGSYPSSILNLNGICLFAADDGMDGRELWRYSTEGSTREIQMRLAVSPEGTGTVTSPLGSRTLSVSQGASVRALSSPSEGYVFLRWETTGSVSVSDRYGTIATFTPRGNATATAIFGRSDEVAPLTLYCEPASGGKTLPAARTVLLNRGETLVITAHPSLGHAFCEWKTDGDVSLVDPLESRSPQAHFSVSGSGGNVTAVFARAAVVPDPELSAPEVRIRIDSKNLSVNSVFISGMPLPISSTDALPVRTKLFIGGQEFSDFADADPPNRDRNGRLIYSPVASQDKNGTYFLTIDPDSGTWSFRAKGIDLTRLVSENGVDILLFLDDELYAQRIHVAQSIKWSFAQRGTASEAGTDSALSILRADGNHSDLPGKRSGNRIRIRRALWADDSAMESFVELPVPPEVAISIDSFSTVFRPVPNAGRSRIRSRVEKNLFHLNPTDGSWSMTANGGNASDITIRDGLDVRISSGDASGECRITPERRILLTYPAR